MMTIREATEKTGLTRKAIAYYEQMGLLSPGRSPGGYRLYTDSDIATLKEIALLRRIGLPAADIAPLIATPDKADRLQALATQMALEEDRRCVQQRALAHLLQGGYDIEATSAYITGELDALSPIRERLLLAFPGGYGLYLHLHFGRFLEGRVDTLEKAAAFDAIIGFLDGAATLDIPPEIDAYTRIAYAAMSQVPGGSTGLIEMAIDDVDSFLEQNREVMEAYIAFRTSDEFAESDAGKMQALMRQFQAQTGYNETFLPNLRILSPAYNDYITRMEAANDRLLQRYPELEKLC